MVERQGRGSAFVQRIWEFFTGTAGCWLIAATMGEVIPLFLPLMLSIAGAMSFITFRELVAYATVPAITFGIYFSMLGEAPPRGVWSWLWFVVCGLGLIILMAGAFVHDLPAVFGRGQNPPGQLFWGVLFFQLAFCAIVLGTCALAKHAENEAEFRIGKLLLRRVDEMYSLTEQATRHLDAYNRDELRTSLVRLGCKLEELKVKLHEVYSINDDETEPKT